MAVAASAAVSARPDRLGIPSTPSVASILRAFEAKGDGDREMLLALLAAKQAEDHVRSYVWPILEIRLISPAAQRLACLDYAYAQQCHLAASRALPRLAVPAPAPCMRSASPPALSAGTSTSSDDDEVADPASPPPRTGSRPPTTWHGRLGKRPPHLMDEDELKHHKAMREVQDRLLARRAPPISAVRGES
jgi:hypothetical protein